MADLTPVNPTIVDATPGEPPVIVTCAGGGDRFPATAGRRYMLRINNGHSSAQNVVVDDPTSGTGVIGSTTAQNPDATIIVPNGTAPANQRVVLLDADRFKDSTGWINLTYSGVTLLTLEVYGPF